jgi:8-amino-7-oxononanoate synthase
MLTETAIVPVLCGDDERAYDLTAAAQAKDLFMLPVVSPAVPNGLARLRATVTAAHEPDEIAYALDVLAHAGKEIGII